MPLVTKLTLIEKTDLKVRFTVLQDIAGTPPVNLTGRTLLFRAKESFDDPDSAKLFEVSVTIIDGPNGIAEADLAASLLTELADGVWELAIWNASPPSSGDFPDARIVGPLVIQPAVLQGGFP